MRKKERPFSLIEYRERKNKNRPLGNDKNKKVKTAQYIFLQPKIRKSGLSTLETKSDSACLKPDEILKTTEPQSFTENVPSFDEVIRELKLRKDAPPTVNQALVFAPTKNKDSITSKKEQRSIYIKKLLLEELEKSFQKPYDQKLKDFIESILMIALVNYNLQNSLHKDPNSKAIA